MPQDTMRKQIREAIADITGHNPNDLEGDLFLESDLGIDSIKMVSLVTSLMQLVPPEQFEAFSQDIPSERLMQVQTLGELDAMFAGLSTGPAQVAPVLSAAPSPAPEAWAAVAPQVNHQAPAAAWAAAPTPSAGNAGASATAQIFELIAGITGHNPGDLDNDMFLESDLGIDSIKMVALTQSLLQLIPESRRDEFLTVVPTEQLMQIPTLGEMVKLLSPWQDSGDGGGALAAAAPVSALAATAAPTSPVAQPVDVEILYSQYPFLVSHWAVATCSLASRIKVKGPFDLNIARQAWTDLMARHPALRAHFVIPPKTTSFKQYRFEVMEGVIAPALAVTDMRHLTPAQQETACCDEIARCVNEQWLLESPLLQRFFVYQLADQVFEVFFANHHLISDGLGNQQVMREFMVLYQAIATRTPADLPPATTVAQYKEAVAAINGWHKPEEDKALVEFIRGQGKQAFFWNPCNAQRTSQRADTQNYRFHVDAVTTQALMDCTRLMRVPMNTLLVAAYLRTIASFGSAQDPIFLNVPTSGRVYPGVDASGMIGCFAQNLALGFPTPAPTEDWQSLVQRVQHDIGSAISAGYDRAQCRQAAIAVREQLHLENGRISEALTGMIRAGIKSNLYLPYIGNTHIATQYGPLTVLDYQAATVTNAGTLDTVAEIFHGCLSCTSNYDRNYHKLEFVIRVANAFLEQLRDLANYQVPLSAANPQAVNAYVDSANAAQVRQVAEEVMHQALRATDLDKDLEADLGLDSLERIRIVARLEHFVGKVNRHALLGCRTLNEMAASLSSQTGSTPAAASSVVSPVATMAAARPSPAPSAMVSAPTAVAPITGAASELAALPYMAIVAQCNRTPDAIAIMSDSSMLSYGQLQRQSNQLAHLLRAQGVGRGSLVGLMMHRGSNLQVAVLGILKAGAAYVPLDPDYPAARLSYMLEHARIATLLVEQAVVAQLTPCLSPTLALSTLVFVDEPVGPTLPNLTSLPRSAWNAYPTQDINCISHPDDPMVVLYTSGSTGKPKGVVLGHRGYANRFDWHQQMFQMRAGERVAQKTSICFDISVWELFWPLMHGATICPVQTAVLRDPWQLAQWVRDSRIDVMHFVPSLFGEFLNAIEEQALEFPNLRQLIFSGEALPVAYVKRWMTRFGQRTGMANLYGPTEASIDVSAHQVMGLPGPTETRIPIGRAMPNVHLLVLDEAMQVLATGVVGELWIGGIQLAHGYLNDPERTAQSFRANPFPHIPGKFLYRTGDLAVQLPDGSFDYRGRIDTQIKIRGFRVELGEIEAVLCTHPSIREAGVLALDYGDGHLRLSAWMSGQAIEVRDLREFLAKSLPHYMLPHRFDWLPSLPKNQNGKLDRNALKKLAEGGPEANAQTSTAIVPTNLAGHYPICPAQYWMLRYFAPPYLWAGFTRFTYLQPLDLDLFNQALNILAQRQPALRSRFYQKDQQWYQHFPQLDIPLQAEYYDGSHLPAEERSTQLRQLIRDRVDGLRIDSGTPLWCVIIIKETSSRYDFCTIGHHMISDLLSNTLLFKSVWDIYRDLLLGAPMPTETKQASFINYLDALEAHRTDEAMASYVNYWTSHYPAKETTTFSVPVDHSTGPNVEASSATERFTLTPLEHTALQRARQRHNCGIYLLLLAPLYRMLAEWSGHARVVLSHRTHGRDFGPGHSYFDAIGDFAINHPVGVRIAGGVAWPNLLAEIRKEFESVPLNGVSYDLVGSRLPSSIYPDSQLTQIRANYLGNRDLRPNTLFEIVDDEWDQRFSPPDQLRISLIEVFFSSADGAMHVDINYSNNFHLPATIRRVGQRYMEMVRDMLAQSAEAAAVGTHAAPAVPRPVSAPPSPSPSSSPFGVSAPAPLAAATMAAAPPAPAPKPFSPATSGQPGVTVMRSLEGKVAIVTGAARGIGRAISLALAAQGARVALVSLTAPQLNKTLQEVRKLNPDAIAITADVTQQAQVESMVREVMAKMGGIDILVNNAGIAGGSLLADSDPKEWQSIVNVNLMSAYLCCRTVLPHMLARGSGKIINMGSASSVVGFPLLSAYCASKHAILGMTRALAEEVKQQNIQVNVICPLLVDTRMTPPALRGSAIPPEQVGDVAVFLASSASDGVTGETINISGRQDLYAHGSEHLNQNQVMKQSYPSGAKK